MPNVTWYNRCNGGLSVPSVFSFSLAEARAAMGSPVPEGLDMDNGPERDLSLFQCIALMLWIKLGVPWFWKLIDQPVPEG